MAFDTDVLICGAGAAGLTLAIDLARHGIDSILVEQNAQPFGGSRGKGLQPRSLEIFEDLGLLDRLMEAGGPYPPLLVYRADGSREKTSLSEDRTTPSPAEPYAHPLMVAQFRTEAVLRERLAELGQQPRFGCQLTGFEQDADGVSARIQDATGSHTLRARYLIGTDGGRSFVRNALGIGFPGQSLGVRALVADVDLTGLDRLSWHRFQLGTAATQIMVCPLVGTELFQIQAPVPLEGEVDLSAQGLTSLLRDRSDRDDIVVQSVVWSSVYSMSSRLADRYRVGRVFLAGDAAHIHPPTGGQGLNTSVQDAYNLGWKLAAVLKGAPDALLETYEEERRPIASDMLDLSTRMLGEARDGRMRRNREVRQMDLGYRASSLSQSERAETARIKAGDRAPDAPCRTPDGQQTRLFTLFQGPEWILMGQNVQNRPAASSGLRIITVGDGGDVVDNNGFIAEAYGLDGNEWVLIRPDGYIAAFSSSEGLKETLSHYREVAIPASAPSPSDPEKKHIA
ncbi:FAD-dependent oxidoreductase [Gluconobacter albidus]|uniref:FAD-dependent oxidoreductase n=1 Tax=Gluconobacter albidus TaxID=318683 RepID=UPI0030B63005